MVARATKAACVCLLLSGCAPLTADPVALGPSARAEGDPHDAPDSTATPVDPWSERIRFVDQADVGMQSLVLIPTVVRRMVAVGPMARSRVFVGALFATRKMGPNRVAGLALVFRSVGGGLGPALAVSPRVVLEVDGERVMQVSLARTGLYSMEVGPWGPVENVMVPVAPDVVERIAAGTVVFVSIGDGVGFQLDAGHLDDLSHFVSRLPEDVTFGLRRELVVSAIPKTQD